MPEATPKREAVRERMFETTLGDVSCGRKRGLYLDRLWMYGDRCGLITYLCIMLHGLLNYRRDGKFVLGGHNWSSLQRVRYGKELRAGSLSRNSG